VAPLTVGSLFAGIGGFDLAAERVGFEVRWQVEIDDYCNRVLEKHWPHVRRYGDVRNVRDLEAVDIVCGGFPCQDISVAGKGEGIDGERSGLWREFYRLIGELRPRFVVVENVSALVVRGLGRVLGDLAARGYDAEWDCIPASAAGAPHRRDRIWIVAYPHASERREGITGRDHADGHLSGRQEATGRFVPSGEALAYADRGRCEQRHQAERGVPIVDASGDVPDTLRDGWRQGRARRAARVCDADEGLSRWTDAPDADGAGRGEQWRIFPIRAQFATAECCRWWGTEPDVGRVAHGVPARVDRLRGLGNAIVPQVAEWIFQRIKEADGEAQSLRESKG
jgi:DNA (cytosine-5)-methyltransferase 1